jgi:hypothetical protein
MLNRSDMLAFSWLTSASRKVLLVYDAFRY